MWTTLPHLLRTSIVFVQAKQAEVEQQWDDVGDAKDRTMKNLDTCKKCEWMVMMRMYNVVVVVQWG